MRLPYALHRRPAAYATLSLRSPKSGHSPAPRAVFQYDRLRDGNTGRGADAEWLFLLGWSARLRYGLVQH